MKLPYSRIVNKYYKHKVLAQYDDLKPYLPETEWFNEENLQIMLEKFPVVFIKPSRGTAGIGIFRLEKKINGYSLRFKKMKLDFKDFDVCYNHLLFLIKQVKQNSKRFLGKYIIQQGIPLLKYKNRLFDIRSFVQFNIESNQFEWQGAYARVAHPNKIVTNISNSGMPLSLATVFLEKGELTDELLEKIPFISTQIAESIHEACDEIVEVGLDFGVDTELRLWLIEVNVKPRYKGFKSIDMNVYHNIDKRSKQLKFYLHRKKYHSSMIHQKEEEDSIEEQNGEGEQDENSH